MSSVSVVRLNEATGGTEPAPPRNEVPVYPREHALLQVEEEARWCRLVRVEGSAISTAVFEFAKHELFVADEYGAGGVSIVFGCLASLPKLLQNIVHEDWRLREDRGGGL